MRFRICVAMFLLLAPVAAAQAAGPKHSRHPAAVRPASHRVGSNLHHGAVLHNASCGCQAEEVVHAHAVACDGCGGCGGTCVSARQDCASCGSSCEDGLLSTIFNDLCDAVDSLFCCSDCKSSACDSCDAWDPCGDCDKCSAGRSPRRRPCRQGCNDCSGLWDDFCSGCGDHCAAGGAPGGCTSCGSAGASVPMAAPMEIPADVPAPTPAAPGKSAAGRRSGRSVMRSTSHSGGKASRPVQAAQGLPVLNAAQVNRSASSPNSTAPKAPTETPLTQLATKKAAAASVRPVAALETEIIAPKPATTQPRSPVNPLRGVSK